MPLTPLLLYIYDQGMEEEKQIKGCSIVGIVLSLYVML